MFSGRCFLKESNIGCLNQYYYITLLVFGFDSFFQEVKKSEETYLRCQSNYIIKNRGLSFF